VSGNREEVAKTLAKKQGCTVALTGGTDIVTDGERTVLIQNGSPLMGTVVGTGCMSTSIVGTFAAVEEDAVVAATAGLVCFGIAGEMADFGQGPGTYRATLFDIMAEQETEDIEQCARIEMR
jgi:hydroxyethylthiazole kinase